jgi:hypothetical protein
MTAIGFGMTCLHSTPVWKSMNLIRLSKVQIPSARGHTHFFQPTVSGVTGTSAMACEPCSFEASAQRRSQSPMSVTTYSARCSFVSLLQALFSPFSRLGSTKKERVALCMRDVPNGGFTKMDGKSQESWSPSFWGTLYSTRAPTMLVSFEHGSRSICMTPNAARTASRIHFGVHQSWDWTSGTNPAI